MIISEEPLPYIDSLKTQADTQYACMQENFTASQRSAINKKFKQHRGMSRKDALRAHPWAVINQERKLNLASGHCETADDVKREIDHITDGRPFVPYVVPVEDLSVTY